MPRKTDDLKERLSRYRQIKISVIGKKSGRTISMSLRSEHCLGLRVIHRRLEV
jgi:hypothetical protein